MNKHEIAKIANSIEMAHDLSKGSYVEHLVYAVRNLFEAVLIQQYRSEFHGGRHRDELNFEEWCHENGYWTYCAPKDPEETNAHSCYNNSEYGSDGNEYCSICGRMTKSAEARELDAEQYSYDRQAGDFETF